MRLRQIAMVAGDLESAADDLCAILGIKVAYRDPVVGEFGLHNIVAPVGGEFLEIVSPLRDGTSAGRYIDRRGGDGGYMVILQCDDSKAARERITGMGVRAVWDTDEPDYVATHYHPRDVGGFLLSVDSVTPGLDYTAQMVDWAPGGPDWRAAVSTARVDRLVGADLQSADPVALAQQRSRILDLPLDDSRATPRLNLTNATLRFVPDDDGRGPGVGAIDIRTTDRAAILTAADARGLKRNDTMVEICGLRMNLV